MAAAKAKASRHAVTPQLRPQGKVSLPVAPPVPSRVRDELLFNWSVPPASRAGRRHRQSKSRPLTLVKLVRSRSKEITNRAQVRTCFVESARVAPSRPVREAPYRSIEKQSDGSLR